MKSVLFAFALIASAAYSMDSSAEKGSISTDSGDSIDKKVKRFEAALESMKRLSPATVREYANNETNIDRDYSEVRTAIADISEIADLLDLASLEHLASSIDKLIAKCADAARESRVLAIRLTFEMLILFRRDVLGYIIDSKRCASAAC